MVHRQRLNRIWRCRMALGVARWALALPDGPWRCRMSGGIACGVAVCTVALPGGRGVAGWRGALPDNGPSPLTSFARMLIAWLVAPQDLQG